MAGYVNVRTKRVFCTLSLNLIRSFELNESWSSTTKSYRSWIKEVQMEFDTATKFIFGIVSALGTFAVIFLNSRQAAQVKSELLIKFENALEKEQKHSVTELFRLIHGVRMSYSDIVELVKHDECIKIIYAIRKTPGLVRYENGKFTYTKIAKNPFFKFVDRWIYLTSVVVFSSLTLVSLSMLGFGNGATAVAGFILSLFGASMLAMQLRQRRFDQMVSNLISPSIEP